MGELDDRIVAMGALCPLDQVTAEITRMRVLPDLWRRGFGRAILERLDARAAELGYRVPHLETTAGQTAARALYEKNGYTAVDRSPWRRFEVVVYEKQIGA